MDEITLDGKTYISSKRAASITGYAKDYIGQLCREGRVEARLVGRSWYVYEASLAAHKTEDGRKSERANDSRNDLMSGKHLQEPKVVGAEPASVDLGYGLVGTPVENGETSDISSKYNLYSEPRYTTEDAIELPEFAEEEGSEVLLRTPHSLPVGEAAPPEVKIAEMQNAWQEWFSESVGREEVALTEVRPVTPQDRYVREEPAPVPVRKLVSDIEPQPRSYEEVKVAIEAPRTAEPKRQHTKRSQTRSNGRRSNGRGYGPVFRAGIVAAIILILSVTFVATGLAHSTHIVGTGNPLLDFLSGYTVLIKDNI